MGLINQALEDSKEGIRKLLENQVVSDPRFADLLTKMQKAAEEIGMDLKKTKINKNSD